MVSILPGFDERGWRGPRRGFRGGRRASFKVSEIPAGDFHELARRGRIQLDASHGPTGHEQLGVLTSTVSQAHDAS